MSEIRHRQHDLWQMHEQSKTLVRRQEITPHRQRMQVRTSYALCWLAVYAELGVIVLAHST
jgi:hypothetical protein